MSVWSESKRLTVTCDRFVQFFQLVKASGHGICKVVEIQRTIGMSVKEESKSLTVTCDRLLQIIHFSQLLKASGHGSGNVDAETMNDWDVRERREQALDSVMRLPPPNHPFFPTAQSEWTWQRQG